MKNANLNSVRYKFLLITILSLVAFGCAHGTGTIKVSKPKVWREDAIMMSKGEQVKALRGFKEKFDPLGLQGKRARQNEREIEGGVTMTMPSLTNAPGATSSAESQDTQGTATSGESKDNQDAGSSGSSDTAESTNGSASSGEAQKSTFEIVEESLDAMQRINDFYSIYEGTLLEHLRDSNSQQSGSSLYLLGFDVSVNPGPETRKGYDGYLKFEIVSPSGNEDKFQVYAVSPERYAERFKEEFLGSRELIAKLAANVDKINIDSKYVQRLSDELSKLERYPIVSGFVDGLDNTFGWMFHPRPTIAKGGKKIEYTLEPGIRHCYAYILVKDGSINAPKWFFRVDQNKLAEEMKKLLLSTDKDNSQNAACDGAWFKHLYSQYDVLKEMANHDDQSIDNFFMDAFGFSDEFKCENLRSKIKNRKSILKIGKIRTFKEIKKDKRNLKESSEETLEQEKEKLEELIRPFKDLHIAMLGLVGRQGEGNHEFTIKVTGGWINRSGNWMDRFKDEEKYFAEPFYGKEQKTPTEMKVSLPDKIDRTLDTIWAVWPEEAPEKKETWVSIKGHGFTNDAQVFMGHQKALPEDVQVVSSRTILAKFPEYTMRDGNKEEECYRVKVYSGGEAMVSSKDAFCYKPIAVATQTPLNGFKVTSVSPTKGKDGDKITIKANMGIMDKVERVIVGDIVCRKIILKDNKTLEIVLGKLPETQTSGKLKEIHINFKKGTDVVPDNEYIVPTGFKYLL